MGSPKKHKIPDLFPFGPEGEDAKTVRPQKRQMVRSILILHGSVRDINLKEYKNV